MESLLNIITIVFLLTGFLFIFALSVAIIGFCLEFLKD